MNLKQLARTLSLSPTTVSRALNGYPEVNEATRERVLAAAKRYNYQPNARALRLATGKSKAIGHVIPIASRHEMVNPVFADFIAGAGEVYARAGFDMVLSQVTGDNEADAYRDLSRRGAVDGIILHGARVEDPRIALLEGLCLPFLMHGRSSGTETPYSWVDVNNRRAFRRACDFLIDFGHRRIALLNGLEFMDFAMRRRCGFEQAFAERGLATDPALIASTEMTEGQGYALAARMLSEPQPPTAFLASSIILGMGIRRAIEERGLRLGRDVSVIIHDDDLSFMKNGEELPIFTATRSSVREAGRHAAEMLLAIIDDPTAAPQARLLEAELIIGQSTGPAQPHTSHQGFF